MRRKTLVAVGAMAAVCAGTSTSAGAVAAPAITRIHTAAASSAVQLPSDWLAQMNAYRANYGVPNVVEDPVLSAADAQHVHWMAVNNTMMHGEIPGTPSYTVAGDQAGARSNLSMGWTDAIGGWMAAPFHALGILRPTLQRTGYAFDPDGNWAALDVLSRNGGPAPATTRFPMTWPSSRSPVDLLSYDGGESPDPLAGCGQVSSNGWGLPLIASFGYNRDVRVKSAVLRNSTGHVVPVCLRDASSYPGVGSAILKEWGTVLVIPRERLSWDTHYTGSVTTDAGTATLDFLTAPPPQQQVQRYIARVYFDLFNRTPDPSGLATWTNRLISGTPRVAVANAITSSAEYRSKLIAGSYLKYLGRAPDQAGLNTWLAAMNRGFTVSRMEAGFIASPEYFLKAGNTNATWVVKLYADVLGRAAGPSEVQHWTASLSAGASRNQVAMGFLISKERLSTVVDGYYQKLLGRNLDPAGLVTWVRKLQAGEKNETIIGGIISSPEYWSRN